MDELPQENGERLLWHIGRHDPRKDHGMERIGLVLITVIFIIIQLPFGSAIYPDTDEQGRWILIALFLGMWLLLIFGVIAVFVYRRHIKFDVLTQVALSPQETTDRLRKVLPEGVKKLKYVKRNPEIHSEFARFNVTMGWKEEAIVVVHLINQLYDGPTDIRIRSPVNIDEWRDLRGLIEDGFRDATGPKEEDDADSPE
jgi:hypothetical protein